MKKITVILLLILISLSGMAQEKKTKIYGSFSLEMPFEFAIIDNQGNTTGNIMRWAPVINPQVMVNFNFNPYFGLFTGGAIRNVGFIYDNPYDSNDARYKFRTYNFGIPVGFKVGKLDKFFFFAGYEVEFPFAYKEKKFVNEEKVEKNVIWFTDRVEPVQSSVLAGLALPYGFTVKFKYYMTNFFNKDYTAMVDGQPTQPYNFDANVWYFSLAWDVFTSWGEYNPKSWKNEMR
jgi:hypothetical protein